MAEELPVVFLFDAELASFSYGDRFDAAFLRALKTVDIKCMTRSRVIRGDLLIHQLAYKPAKVSMIPGAPSARTGLRSRSTSIEMRGDKDFFATLIGDLCDAFAGQWNTLDLVFLAELIGRHRIHCMFLPTLPQSLAGDLDQRLRAESCYLGAVVPDLGNPLQRNLFADWLVRDAFIENGQVYMTLSYEGYFEGHFAGVEEFSQKAIIAIPPEDFASRSPPICKPAALSARGLVTLARLEKCLALSVHERLASALPDQVKEPGKEFTWDIRQLPNAPDEVIVQARKLTEYLLNTEHKDGGGKAKFFETDLGITSGDWQYLQAQLVDALSSTVLDDVSLDQYGIRFNAVLPVHGRNGRIATIRTGWIVRQGERASLVTAYPADEKPDPALNVKEPAVVDHRLAGDKRWEAIFALACEAGESAALACVPRLLKIVGYPVEMEGDCGGAYVRVPNARTGFARWLKVAGHASHHYRSGVCFYARKESQSAERAKTYAEAFAKVLRRNGVECSVETYFT